MFIHPLNKGNMGPWRLAQLYLRNQQLERGKISMALVKLLNVKTAGI